MSCPSYLESVTVNHLMFAGPLFCIFFVRGMKLKIKHYKSNIVMTRHQYFALAVITGNRLVTKERCSSFITIQ